MKLSFILNASKSIKKKHTIKLIINAQFNLKTNKDDCLSLIVLMDIIIIMKSLIVIGPSGVGKGTIISQLLKKYSIF